MGAETDLVIKIITLIVAAVGGGLALRQYRQNQKWKETEFIANLYKEFADNLSCQRAMWMLDWNGRDIDFGPLGKEWCDWGILKSALRKHDSAPFTELEMYIRDTFDKFFSYIEQFERAIRNELIDQDQVYPYFAYWIDLLLGGRHLGPDVRARVLGYIKIYGFSDVHEFLNRWPEKKT